MLEGGTTGEKGTSVEEGWAMKFLAKSSSSTLIACCWVDVG